MASVLLRYWAGAREAAGTAEEQLEAESVAAALLIARDRRADPQFARVLGVSTLLVDGVRLSGSELEAPLAGPVVAEVLPPYAGG